MKCLTLKTLFLLSACSLSLAYASTDSSASKPLLDQDEKIISQESSERPFLSVSVPTDSTSSDGEEDLAGFCPATPQNTPDTTSENTPESPRKKIQLNEKAVKFGDLQKRLAYLDLNDTWDTYRQKTGENEMYVPSLHVYGGGVRGIIPATILRGMEEISGKRVINLFEFFSGTSTGGILVGALNVGDYSAADIVELYKNHSSEIFGSRYYVNPYGTRGSKYDIKNLRSVLSEYVHKDATLKDFKKDVLLPMYDVRSSNTMVLKSWKAKEDESRNFFAIDALSGTAAAPTYFSPVKMYNYPGDDKNKFRREFYMVDGGIYANAPTGCGYNALQELYGKDVKHIAVALGTGKPTPERLQYGALSNMGTLGVVPHLIDWMIQGNVAKTEYEMTSYLPEIQGIPQYYLFNPTIDRVYAGLDNTKNSNLDQLEQYGIDILDKEEGEITSLVRRLEDLRDDDRLAKKLTKQKNSPSKQSRSFPSVRALSTVNNSGSESGEESGEESGSESEEEI